MATVNVIYKPWEYRCGDGCCSDYGMQAEINVGYFKFHIDGTNEEDVLKQFIERHYNDYVETEYVYEDEMYES